MRRNAVIGLRMTSCAIVFFVKDDRCCDGHKSDGDKRVVKTMGKIFFIFFKEFVDSLRFIYSVLNPDGDHGYRIGNVLNQSADKTSESI